MREQRNIRRSADCGLLALDGDARAKRLFLGSPDHAIAAGRHSDCAWPIRFEIDSVEAIVAAPDPKFCRRTPTRPCEPLNIAREAAEAGRNLAKNMRLPFVNP